MRPGPALVFGPWELRKKKHTSLFGALQEEKVLKNRAAVSLGRRRMEKMTPEERSEFARLGGLKGGKARKNKLSAARRTAIARKAAKTRWEKLK